MVLSELEQLLYIDIPMNVNKYFCKVHNTAKFTKLPKIPNFEWNFGRESVRKVADGWLDV